MKISIAIPCYNMGGVGSKYLERSFLQIEKQNFKDFEVVVTDHSLSHQKSIERLCSVWSNKFKLKYYHNENDVGSPSSNTNFSIEKSSCELIKLLCQDDYLYNEDSLKTIVDNFTEDVNWLATSYIHNNESGNFYNIHTPSFNENIHLINTLGTPSCVTIRNGKGIKFDTKLVYMYDCEFYKRYSDKYGKPKIIDSLGMVCFLHSKQVTNSIVTNDLIRDEQRYVKNKHS